MVEKYSKEKQNAERDLKLLIYNNYKTFISLSDNISNVQSFFSNLKKQFSQYDEVLNILEDILIEEKRFVMNLKKKRGGKSDLFDDDIDDVDEEDILEQLKKKRSTLATSTSPTKFSGMT